MLHAHGDVLLFTDADLSSPIAEGRKLFAAMLDKLGLRQTPNGSAVSMEEAVAIANRIGYPVLVRPSFVLGGRAMELVYNDKDLQRYMQSAIEVSPERPVLVDRFLEDAMEVDVDCISDGETTVIGAIMEHIEQAGIHSGDVVISANGTKVLAAQDLQKLMLNLRAGSPLSVTLIRNGALVDVVASLSELTGV